MDATFPFSPEEWATCIRVLEQLKNDPFNNPDNQTLKTLITSIHKQAKREGKSKRSADRKAADEELLQHTTILSDAAAGTMQHAHREPEAERSGVQLNSSRYCYVCRAQYRELHFFYHRLCPDCAAAHYEKRKQPHDLDGHTVILTGGRVKIGYATALMLLRSGARLILTTRFPATAMAQLQQEADFMRWSDRLHVYGLDLRDLHEVRQFIAWCHGEIGALDILINNAAQTIRYPEAYYRPIIAAEQKLLAQGPAAVIPNATPATAAAPALPDSVWLETTGNEPLNRFGQPVDHRDANSWNARLDGIGLEELLEVNLINHISPYCLIAGMKDLLIRSRSPRKHIINVTSSEGQFSYPNKTIHHPHTNMTKAALNMLTRTSGAELVQDGIYMNAVDVGWVSTGAPEAKRTRLFDELRIPPLDPVDGAARILHAISEVKDRREDWHGLLLKDYGVAEW